MATTNNNLSDYNMEEVPSSEGMRFAIIVSEWNNHITENLYIGAEKTLIKLGTKQNDIVRIDVPGSFELVFGAKIASKYNYDAIICLGSVIKGETDHFDYICNAVSLGIKDLNVHGDVPVIFGVLTDNNEQQSIDRSGGKHGNKGIEAAITAIKMAVLNK
ncbi:MAG: 6,7-dimethyl-8-ribityllumazine synthase [Flavobacteriales bacterium]|jgi:6,7-dimethyl-8-ribityllumazine synthase|nr:6,7-dimethyl-8-ribityllumazine synthase [Flavobacteriales bacterium]MBT6700002.1 6,7-dimethyl-8-ribityllumazine synthase [Flavobacteriales bacterium]MBT6815015.1 6,7-dimethyl-8-ribityllumazine synthase [Flavobacteriales bacterium]MBT7726919.1 6,7-dimethyl-8-ribityllumazine synthase [Flavobacteriales bacterium]